MTNNVISNKGKILVVDDEKDWREMIADLLREANYFVTTAVDRAEAMHHLRERPYHLIIIDKRLQPDEKNRDGLVLAAAIRNEMPEQGIVIYTNFAEKEDYREVLTLKNGHRTADDFLEKDASSEVLLQKLEMVLVERKVNPSLEIEIDPELDWLQLQKSVECLRHLKPEIAQEEIAVVLQRLFFNAKSVVLKPLRGGHSSASIFLVQVIRKDGSRAGNTIIVKLDSQDKAAQEADNFKQHVSDHLGGARHTHLHSFRQCARLGGISYSLVGTSTNAFQSFENAYQEGSSQSVAKILDNLFKETCRDWYQNTEPSLQMQILSSHYKASLRLSPKKTTSAFDELLRETGYGGTPSERPIIITSSGVEIPSRSVNLPHPMDLFYSPFGYEGPLCLSHGDLNEGNILVDTYGETWLIDFFSTGQGHPVRDFAMLESVVKFSLQQSRASLTTLYDWENALLNANNFSNYPEFPDDFRLEPELKKATKIILHIRLLLSEILPHMTMKDYSISLYFHALKAMTLSSKLSLEQRQHALICAAILANKLQNGVNK